jgi:hypothetical protein
MRLTWIERRKVMEEALLWRPPSCNLCSLSTLWWGLRLTNLLYWHLSCFWKSLLYTEHCSILLMENPISLPIFSSCFHCSVWVFVVCASLICLCQLAVLSDGQQELILLSSLDVAGCTNFRNDQSSCARWHFFFTPFPMFIKCTNLSHFLRYVYLSLESLGCPSY